MSDATNRRSFVNGWNDGRKHGRNEMRKLIRRRLRRLAEHGGYDAAAANALDDAACIVTAPTEPAGRAYNEAIAQAIVAGLRDTMRRRDTATKEIK